ncbi:hypothetical protein PCI56_21180 [Plesiomonas shigelloides subsp. oncorhynchi]|nr:hypothetical protein [Plesiomonas shigelloides]
MLALAGCSSLSEPREAASIIIKNGTVLTMDQNNTVINNGVVVIRDNKIVSVGDAKLLERYRAAKVIDAEEGIIMPGMINTHNHIPMVAFRGLGRGDQNRLFAYFFPLEGKTQPRSDL